MGVLPAGAGGPCEPRSPDDPRRDAILHERRIVSYIRYMAVGGFKSLRDWNLLELSPRVSVLVGGNGTGKSSLVEALLWALGEDDADQLRVSRSADLVYEAPAVTAPAFRIEDILFHSTASPSAGGSETGVPTEVVEASVYLVMGEEAAEGGAGEEGEACCCKRRTDQSARELPPGSLSVGRSVDRVGRVKWEVDGVVADSDVVRAALARHMVGRDTVSVIRQGELERVLAADDRLRARIIAEAAGLTGGDVDDLRERRLGLEADREWLTAELERTEREAPTPAAADAAAPAAQAAALATPGVQAMAMSPPVAVAPERGEWAHQVEMVVAALAARDADSRAIGLSPSEAAELLGISGSAEGLGPDTVGVAGGALRARQGELERRLQEVEQTLAEVARDEARALETERDLHAAAVGRVADRADRHFQALVPGGSLRLTLGDGSVGERAPGSSAPTPSAPAATVGVSFPGQPEVHLDALSGGQRALVAFALGVAVFEESPSRLMVLDEVEPALDESNLRRFNGLLQGIAATRQVVIVSHQRRTKDVGDVVFGVDHLGDGASGLLFRFEPGTRRLVIFGRTRGNWLDRNAPELQEDGGTSLTGPRSPGATVRWGR